MLGKDSNEQIGVIDEFELEECKDANIGRFEIKK